MPKSWGDRPSLPGTPPAPAGQTPGAGGLLPGNLLPGGLPGRAAMITATGARL